MSMHVVHIEDEGPLRDILKIALMAADPNLDLVQFASGDEAIDYIRQRGKMANLFVIDIRLPGTLNGIKIAHMIRELKCPGFIVLTSAYGSPERNILTTLDCEYLAKPWHIPDLVEKLSRYRRSERIAKSENSITTTDSPILQPGSMVTRKLEPLPVTTEIRDTKTFVCASCGYIYQRGDFVCAKCGMLLNDAETRRLSDTEKQADKLPTHPSHNIGEAFSPGIQTLILEVEGQQLTIPTQDTIVVGRRTGGGNSSQLDVDLSFFQAVLKGVSRRHVQITRKGALIYVTDLDTLNGTWLNGRRLSGYNERLLRDSDELKLGQLKIRVRFK